MTLAGVSLGRRNEAASLLNSNQKELVHILFLFFLLAGWSSQSTVAQRFLPATAFFGRGAFLVLGVVVFFLFEEAEAAVFAL